MLDVLIVFAVVLIVVGLAGALLLAKRRRDLAMPVSAPKRGGRERAPVEQAYDLTGPVEVIGSAPASVPLTPIAATAGPAPAIGEPPPLFDLDLEPDLAVPAPEIRWSTGFDPRSGSLDEISRLRLIGDLGVVAKEWCVPLLCRAYEEERRPANRQAALISLAMCRSRAAIPTYRLALASGDLDERAIAADALADLEPPAQTKPRTVVERR